MFFFQINSFANSSDIQSFQHFSNTIHLSLKWLSEHLNTSKCLFLWIIQREIFCNMIKYELRNYLAIKMIKLSKYKYCSKNIIAILLKILFLGGLISVSECFGMRLR